jgi:uncharacterized protein YkwD
MLMAAPAAAAPGDELAATARGVPIADCLDSREQQLLTLINAYRAAHRLPALTATKSLNRASYLHSRDMGVRNYLSHVSPDGRTPWVRMKQQGYAYNTYKAENLFGGGYGTPGEAVRTWKRSPEHNRNMLSPRYRAIGIGYHRAPGSKWTHYYTTDFGGVVDAAPKCR